MKTIFFPSFEALGDVKTPISGEILLSSLFLVFKTKIAVCCHGGTRSLSELFPVNKIFVLSIH